MSGTRSYLLWFALTALGGLIGALFGNIIIFSTAADSPPSIDPRISQLFFTSLRSRYFIAGMLIGGSIGVAQAFLLQHRIIHATRWILANAAAWSLGLPLAYYLRNDIFKADTFIETGAIMAISIALPVSLAQMIVIGKSFSISIELFLVSLIAWSAGLFTAYGRNIGFIFTALYRFPSVAEPHLSVLTGRYVFETFLLLLSCLIAAAISSIPMIRLIRRLELPPHDLISTHSSKTLRTSHLYQSKGLFSFCWILGSCIALVLSHDLLAHMSGNAFIITRGPQGIFPQNTVVPGTMVSAIAWSAMYYSVGLFQLILLPKRSSFVYLWPIFGAVGLLLVPVAPPLGLIASGILQWLSIRSLLLTKLSFPVLCYGIPSLVILGLYVYMFLGPVPIIPPPGPSFQERFNRTTNLVSFTMFIIIICTGIWIEKSIRRRIATS